MPFTDIEKRRQYQKEWRRTKRAERAAQRPSRACSWCGTIFQPLHLHPERQQFCSGKCRTASTRAKKKAIATT